MRWPHFEHIFFDCDSTLTTVEGIDILAESADKKWRVEVLTKAAMDGRLDLEDVYAKRLAAVRPLRKQVTAITRAYRDNPVEDAAVLIAALKELGHKIYIISGGLLEPVANFGVHLGVERSQIRAVDLEYDQLSGNWWEKRDDAAPEDRYLDFDEGPLTISDGKAQIVRELLGDQPGRSLLIGDGNSDLRASRAVDLFVGYGGVESRATVLAESPAFIHTTSLAPLLALAAGPGLMQALRSSAFAKLEEKACHLIEDGGITFNDERLKSKFNAAYQSVYSRTS